MSRRARNALALGICACVATAPAFAQDAATSGTAPGATGAAAATQATAAGATETPAPATAEGRDLAPTLSGYYQALLARRLVAPESGTDQRLRALVQRAEAAYLRESYDETTLLLFEVVESPRFADFSDLDDFRGAEFMLAGALSRLGAARTAARYLDRILARGPSDAYFAPAVRRYVDLALETGDFAGVERSLSAAIGSRTASLSADSQNELRYLRARLLEANGDAAGAERAYAGITRRSRFYAGAQYLRGVIAANQRRWRDAERLFCSIVETPDESTFTFYVDDRYFEVKDQAWLALGRVAHERVRGRRADDAFYYFFQVPQDSPRLAEAFFGAAYAMYEGEQHDAAIDVLDQLDALFPDTAFADEGAVLRGYIHLGRCEFDPADRLFRRFIARYDPVLREIQNVLRDPARQAGLYASLLDEERAERDRESRRSAADRRVADVETRPRGPRTVRGRLLEMLVVDDEFYRLHADVRILDAESGRAG
ncbi:MAG: hypothetical protein IT379_25730, partial [Deltaproteobacteria bacterium]|nr:hypothetical protein [Deltaproteobacteria bacterium]